MGSKKERSKINQEKRQAIQLKKEESIKEEKNRKGRALVNIITLLSVLVLLWVSGFMNTSISTISSKDELANNLKNNLELTEPVPKEIIDCDDALFNIYVDGDVSGIAKATRKGNLYNRYGFTEKTNFTKEINYLIHKSKTNDTTYIVLYGNIKDTGIIKAEISFNNKTEVVEIESPTNDYFITSISVPSSENVDSIDIKLFNSSNEDVTYKFS